MNWPNVQLSQGLADIVRGVTFSQGDSIHESRDGFLPVLRAGNIAERLEIARDLVWIPERFVSERQRLRKNDIVMCTSSGSALVVGKTAIAEDDFDGSWGAFNAVLRPTQAVVPKFLYYWLQSSDFRAWRDRQAKGANIQNIRHSDLANLAMPLPAKSEQSRIVELLDEAARLRRLRREADAKAARILPALFLKMFGDPATNPMGWPETTVGALLESTDYGTSTKASDEGEGLPLIRMGNVAYDGTLQLSDLKYVELGETEATKYRLQHGDILFNRTNSKELVGKTGLWDSDLDAVLASYFIRLRVNREFVEPMFLWALMNSSHMKRVLQATARGAIGQANINTGELRALPTYIPPLFIQQSFVATARAIRAVIPERREHSDLEELFDLIIQRAFSGQLTAKWREDHMQELLEEMSQQGRALNPPQPRKLEARS